MYVYITINSFLLNDIAGNLQEIIYRGLIDSQLFPCLKTTLVSRSKAPLVLS